MSSRLHVSSACGSCGCCPGCVESTETYGIETYGVLKTSRAACRTVGDEHTASRTQCRSQRWLEEGGWRLNKAVPQDLRCILVAHRRPVTSCTLGTSSSLLARVQQRLADAGHGVVLASALHRCCPGRVPAPTARYSGLSVKKTGFRGTPPFLSLSTALIHPTPWFLSSSQSADPKDF